MNAPPENGAAPRFAAATPSLLRFSVKQTLSLHAARVKRHDCGRTSYDAF